MKKNPPENQANEMEKGTYEIVFGLPILSRKLLGYRHGSLTAGSDIWFAIYEVETPEGIKYLALESDGCCGLSWLKERPAITTSEELPGWFPKDPWTEFGPM